MQFKSVVFVIIVTLLTGAIFSSSAYFVSAEIVTSCSGTSKKTTECTTYDTEANKLDKWKCTLNKDGKTWSCTKAMIVAPSSISPNLDRALDFAVQEKSDNNTKLSTGDFLKDKSILSGKSIDNNNINNDDLNSTISK
ncbi:MAG: hypothetical protein E6K94_11585 [Thaumarchaeota archaeon]|nr:MAG: hypothetical protein E6K94_11585 [Nitrososphaerota archaeon]